MAVKRRSGRPATEATVERVTIINLKGSKEFRDWLSGLTETTLIPSAAIVRDALLLWAKTKGHPSPPKQ